MASKIAVVTGGAGFIGSHLVDGLLDAGYEVRVIDNLVAGKRERISPKAVFVEADVRYRDEFEGAFKGATHVFHLAALPRVEHSIQHPEETHDVNVSSVVNVLTAARDMGVRRVIFASSAAIYGDSSEAPFSEEACPMPLSPYALHKFVGEQYLALFSRLYNLATVSLRFFNVYGPRLDPEGPYALVMGRFLKLRKEGKPLTITGDGKQTRDYIHVSDVVRGLIAAAESDTVGKGEVINLGTGIPTSVNELADYFGGERTYIEPRVEPRESYGSIQRAKEMLNWEPKVSLKEGIEELKNQFQS